MATATRIGPLARMAVRRRVREQMQAELGPKGRRLTRAKVNELLSVVTDDVIDDAADLSEPPPVRGPILDWIKANPEFIQRIVELILALLV